MIAAVFLFLLVPVSGCAVCCAAAERRFEEAAPLVLMALTLLLFCFGLVGALPAGVWAALLLTAAGVLFTLFRLKKRGSFRPFARRFFTSGFGLFLLLALALLFVQYGHMLAVWDDFSHWGDAVRVMCALDDFPTNPLSHSLYPDYPPGLSPLLYFFQKLIALCAPGLGFAEWALFYAQQLFFFSLFLPFTKNLNLRRPWAWLFLGLLFLCPLPFEELAEQYQNLYVDVFMAALFATALARCLSAEELRPFDRAAVCLSLAFLGLFKGMGPLLALLGAGFFALTLRGRRPGEKNGLGSFGALGCALVPRLLWMLHVRLRGVGDTFSPSLAGGLAGPDGTRIQSIKNFLHAFLSRNVILDRNSDLNEHFFVTPIFLMAVTMALLYFALALMMRRMPERRRFYKQAFWAFFAAALICTGATCLSYAFTFTQEEALSLASFSRYVCTVFLAGLYLELLLAAELIGMGALDGGRFTALVFCVQAALTPWNLVLDYADRGVTNYTVEYRQIYEDVLDKARALTAEEPGRFYVLAVSPADNILLRYALRPSTTNMDYAFALETGWDTAGIPNGYAGETDPAAAWRRDLREGYDYVLLYELNDRLKESFSDAFEDPAEIRGGSVYRVDRETGRLSLCP